MTFHFTDPDGDHLNLHGMRDDDDRPVVHIGTSVDGVYIDVDRIEELVAGLRDTARQAAYGQLSAGQAPATDHTALRDRIAAAMREHYLSTNRDDADADRNMPCRCGDWREPGAEADDENDWDTHLADAVLAVLPAPTDRAAVLREAADEISGIDFHPNARARSLDIAAGLARRLRRLADETPATQTPAESIEPTTEEVVRDHVTALHLIGEQLATIEGWFWEHLAAVRAADEPDAAAQRPGLRDRHRAAWAALTPEQQTARIAELDEPDHVCNSVWARDEMDEVLGYLICGVCGKAKIGVRQDGATP